jgi:REP element-mobilizing transposase RayT
MARQPRKLSETGIYHIVFRGVNHCHLFEEREDFEKLLGILTQIKEELSLEIYAYCLLDNHVHLLFKEASQGDISQVMRKLLTPYASWFNRKYQRSGALIANRYRSECVESDEYLLTLVRYIHQNPLLAGSTKRIDAYLWSSYGAYSKARPSLVDTALVLGMLSLENDQAKDAFISFHDNLESRDFSLPDKTMKSDEQIRQEIVSALGELNPSAVCGLPKIERTAVLSSLKKQGFSIRQIERVTGVSRGIVSNACQSQ